MLPTKSVPTRAPKSPDLVFTAPENQAPFGPLVGTRRFSGPALRDTARLSQRYPLIARYGVFDVSTWPIVCDTPSPFSERFPIGEHAKWRCDTPPPLKRGVSAIAARYPKKARQKGAIPPSAILSRKILRDTGGGVSRIGPLSASAANGVFLFRQRILTTCQPFKTSARSNIFAFGLAHRIFVMCPCSLEWWWG